MKKKILILLILVGGWCLSLFFLEAQALEEKIEDLSASVEVAPIFSLSLDNPNLAFSLIGPGKTEILGEGRFFNELKCRSNSGRTWYLKAQLVSLKLLEKDYSLPAPNLKWKVVESSGSAEPLGGRVEFEGFSNEPLLIYASYGDDNRGKEVILRFQYSLSCPLEAPAGNYIGSIIFTLTESP